MRCYHVDRKGRRCRRAFHLSGLHSYEPVAKVGAKKTRELVAEGLFREEVCVNAEGWCEARGAIRAEGGWVCWDRPHIGVDAHHVFPSDRDHGMHDPLRGLWVCREAHAWIHTHPDDAAKLGMLLREGTDYPAC